MDMGNKKKYTENLLPENYKYQIDIWCKAHNINHEKLILFNDFLISLFNLVDRTYLGEDVMILEKHQKEHFTWCWNRIIVNFSKENIHFGPNGKYYDYLWSFFYEAFYLSKLNNSEIKILDYFKILFDFNHIKTRSEIDVLTDIYKLMNENLKK